MLQGWLCLYDGNANIYVYTVNVYFKHFSVFQMTVGREFFGVCLDRFRQVAGVWQPEPEGYLAAPAKRKPAAWHPEPSLSYKVDIGLMEVNLIWTDSTWIKEKLKKERAKTYILCWHKEAEIKLMSLSKNEWTRRKNRTEETEDQVWWKSDENKRRSASRRNRKCGSCWTRLDCVSGVMYAGEMHSWLLHAVELERGIFPANLSASFCFGNTRLRAMTHSSLSRTQGKQTQVSFLEPFYTKYCQDT